ncbi:MAG: hypothetical protein CMJ40_07165 [Phycisphaerae bacterium]|nr:hypothetical protein [Phycisphaerae bacterium]|tara:strand:- start:646 stop:1533 length:888 start_codon:yes stop_codon:yes gene_type:complete
MSGHRFFNTLRSGLAPLIRPVLEGVGPVRRLGLWMLSCRQPEEVELDGQIFRVDPRDFGVTLELHSTGTYEPFTRGLCLDALESGMVFLDIGAHVGLYTLPAARRVGEAGRVIAFEPHPSNRGLLEENLARNNVQNVTVVPAAVSNSPGVLELQVSSFNTGDHRLYRGSSTRAKTVRTDVVSVDAWLESAGISKVDMVKMDVQGAEASVLEGMRRTMESNRELRMIIEYTPWMLRESGADPMAVLTDLESDGFALSIIDEAHGTVQSASAADVHKACPGRSYVNILAVRRGPDEV